MNITTSLDPLACLIVGILILILSRMLNMTRCFFPPIEVHHEQNATGIIVRIVLSN